MNEDKIKEHIISKYSLDNKLLVKKEIQDNLEQTIKLLEGNLNSFKVTLSDLEYDVILFVENNSVKGWLPSYMVEESPVVWVEEDGEKIDYYYNIRATFLFNLPDTFAFVPPEAPIRIWSFQKKAWYDPKSKSYIYDSSAKRDFEEQYG